MNEKEKWFRALSDVDPTYVEEAEPYTARNIRKTRRKKLVAVAILALMVTVSVWLFVPYDTSPPSVDSYKDSDYFDVISYVNLITHQKPKFKNNYEMLLDSLMSMIRSFGSNYGGNPNGFKLGSVNTTSSCTRTLKNCLAFDHAKKGFDNNNSSVTAYFNHCVAFDNGYNYYIQPLSIKGWTSVQGFSGKSADKLPSGRSVTTPASGNQSSIRKSVESTKNTIIANCQANKIPGKTAFNIYLTLAL